MFERVWHREVLRSGLTNPDLLVSKRGEVNEPRNVASYLIRHVRGDTLSAMCKAFGLKKTVQQEG